MSKLDKLAKNGNLILLAAYIKRQCNCTDEKAWDLAYGLCDVLDSVIQEQMYEEPEIEEFDNAEI